MHHLIVNSGDELRAAAAWFEALRLERRRHRIRTGNAQELYFPVCFELAVTKGPPTRQDSQTAAAVLGEIHRERDRIGIEALHRYVADADVVATLAKQLERSWRDIRAGEVVIDPFRAELGTVLGAVSSHGAAAARQRVWSAMITDPTPYNLGALAHTETTRLPWSIVEIGLSSAAPQRRPLVAQSSEGERPLDRSVVDRVRATLRRALDRDALPEIPLLCEEEVDRACAPWGCWPKTNRPRWWPASRSRSSWLRWIRPHPAATTWQRKFRRGSERKPMCCTPGATWPRTAQFIPANGKWSTTSPPTRSPT